ncbi:hypothetical protein BKA93DRAFT_808229 [Sparassis latifolia]
MLALLLPLILAFPVATVLLVHFRALFVGREASSPKGATVEVRFGPFFDVDTSFGAGAKMGAASGVSRGTDGRL